MKKIRILMLVDHLYEDLELWYPKLRLIEAHADVVVAGPEARQIYQGKHGYPCRSDVSIPSVNPDEFDALVLPGGFAPDQLRRSPKVKEITRRMHEAGRLVAFICHAGWIPISAGIVKGYRVTSTPGIMDDLINAGCEWVDEEVVIDRNFITSRRPDDLPSFCREIISYLKL